MSPEDDPVMITRPEFMRRMMEMQRLQSAGDGPDFFADSYNVVVNTNHPLIAQKLVAEGEETGKSLSRYLYQLALLNQGLLKGAELTAFIQRSIQNI
jgi:molecular chaperone HtpG